MTTTPPSLLDQLHLLLSRKRISVGARGLAADVEDVGSGGEQLARQAGLAVEREIAPTITEGLGRGVHDAHQPGALPQLEHALARAQAPRG